VEFNPNQSIVERHARALMGLEETQARIMLKEYAKAAEQLKLQLMAVNSNTFTETRLKSTMLQIELFMQALESRLSSSIFESSEFVFDQALSDCVTEINKFEKEYAGSALIIPIDTIQDSTDPRNVLINQFSSSIKSYNDSTRANIQNVMTQALIQGKTYSQVVNDIDNEIKSSFWKAHRIVRTEMHQIYNVSKMDGMTQIKEKYLPDLKKMLIHPMDSRTANDSKTLAAKNPIVDIDKPFKYKYNGELRVFMAPPERPNDRAILIPVRNEYLDGNG